MQIRIIIQWSRGSHPARFFTLRSISKQLKCLVMGHDEEVVIRDHAMALRCRQCDWQSPGWTFDPSRGTARAQR